jgi:hypothetical protein
MIHGVSILWRDLRLWASRNFISWSERRVRMYRSAADEVCQTQRRCRTVYPSFWMRWQEIAEGVRCPARSNWRTHAKSCSSETAKLTSSDSVKSTSCDTFGFRSVALIKPLLQNVACGRARAQNLTLKRGFKIVMDHNGADPIRAEIPYGRLLVHPTNGCQRPCQTLSSIKRALFEPIC